MIAPPALLLLAPARYALAASGGADSTALLRLSLQCRPDLHLHVAHLDHETRGADSTADAQFVCDLARQHNLLCTVARRSEIEPLLSHRPANRSALYRALRHAFFQRVCASECLGGVLLAHHADDQAETILHRLLRGSSAAGLTGMAAESSLSGMRLLRPLLDVRRQELRAYLGSIGQRWREDASNHSDAYLRNRLRRVLEAHPDLSMSLLTLGPACAELQHWTHRAAPALPEDFSSHQLMALPPVLAAESSRRWLIDRGCPAEALTPTVIQRFIGFATDAASSPRMHFPGRVLLHRRQGSVAAEFGTS